MQLLTVAEKEVSDGSFQNAIAISQAIIEKMVAAYNSIDDSNGVLSGCVAKAFEILGTVVLMEPPEKVRKDVFGWCIKAAPKPGLSGWDAPWDIAMLAADIATEGEETKFIDMVMSLRKGNRAFGDKYDDERAARTILQFMMRVKPEAEAFAFIEENLEFTSIRKIAIQSAVRRQEYARAITLAEEGAATARKERHFGDETTMRKELLGIYRAMNDKPNTVRMAEALFRNDRYDATYYHVLKAEMEAGEWAMRRPDFIEKIRREGDYRSLAAIFAKEASWEELISALEFGNRIELLEEYEKPLLPVYHDRLLRQYIKLISEDLALHAARPTYRRVAKLLRSIMGIYDPGPVQRFAERLRKDYAFRPSLLDELKIIPPPPTGTQ